jgi:response regulator RpfG family c-di-GMP phosphodiesterase
MPSGMYCLGVEVSAASSDVEDPEPIAKRESNGVFVIDDVGRIEKMTRAAAHVFGLEESASLGLVSESTRSERTRGHLEMDPRPYPVARHDAPMKGVVGLQSDTRDFPLKLHVEEPKGDNLRGFVAMANSGTTFEQEVVGGSHARHLSALRDVLRATSATSPLELTRAVLPRIAEQMATHAAAVIFCVEGQSHIEFFGVPPEASSMVSEILLSGDFNHVQLRALTRMHVVAATPLTGATGIFGHVLLFSRNETELDFERMDALESLTRSFAVALDNVVITKQIESFKASRDSAHESILRAMVAALELRDHETEGHTRRVTRISLQLGESLGLRGDELRNLEHGALLHDVGKIGIPDAILHKPGPLTAAEWEVMRKHPQYAYDILSPLPHLSHALDVPYCHHERYDGSGYPRGLQGADIPLAARIFAVVDVYDAMTTERPYRPALPEDYAVAHLKSHAGTHFDPIVVEAFTTLIAVRTVAEPVRD